MGHDLSALGTTAVEAGLDIPAEVVDALNRLGCHYIPARYPEAHAAGQPGQHYGRSDADDAFRDAAIILDWADSRWDSLHDA
jgi:HEPN domain-containing protein